MADVTSPDDADPDDLGLPAWVDPLPESDAEVADAVHLDPTFDPEG